jgi:hypothetical protein
MKRALLWLLLMLLCIPSFTRSFTRAAHFPVESTIPFEITVESTTGNRVLNFYAATVRLYRYTVVHEPLNTMLNAAPRLVPFSRYYT